MIEDDAVVVHVLSDDDCDTGPVVPASRPPHKCTQRSWEHAAHARKHLEVGAAKRRAEKATAAAEESRQVLASVTALLPGAAQLVGKVHVPAVGRKSANLRPLDLLLAARAIFLSPRMGLALGTKHRRLIAAGVCLLLKRQRDGLTRMLASSQRCLSAPNAEGRIIHMSYTHMWDEVELKYQWVVSERFRRNKSAAVGGTLVQKGMLCIDRKSVV